MTLWNKRAVENGTLAKPYRCIKQTKIVLHRNYWACYSICFLLVSALVFSWFWTSGHTFIWRFEGESLNKDGWSQHYKALIYWGRYLRTMIKSLLVNYRFSVPQWDWAVGEGSDVLTTFHYYVIGDPLCLLSVFVPTRYMWILYDFLILLRMYLAGIAFSILCFRTGQRNRYGILAGSMTYIFCSWALLNAARHPYFLNPMIYLPLLVIGIEELIRKKRPILLIGMVFLSAVSNFYFFYMLVIMVAIYVIVRLFMLYRADLRKAVKPLLCITFFSLIGVLLSGVVFLPVMRAFISSSRMSVQNGMWLLYPSVHYSQLPGMLVSNKTSYWLYIGCSVTVIPALFLLFRKKGQHLLLKILFCVCVVVMLFPTLGQAMNGFSYISNRWCFAFILLLSYILTVMWEGLMELSQRDTVFLLLCSGGYFALCLMLEYSRTSETLASMALLFALLCGLIYTNNCTYIHVKMDAVCFRQMFAVGMTLLGILIHSFWMYSASAGHYADESCLVRDVSKINQTEAQIVKSIGENEKEDGLYRYSGRDITPNANMLAGISSTDFYWTISNPYAAEFRAALGVGENSSFRYTNYDDCTALTSLAAVRYYTTLAGDALPLPYGFTYINSFNVYESSTEAARESLKAELGTEELPDRQEQLIFNESSLCYSVYRNDYALPMTYAYDNSISTAKWSSLNSVQKQETLLQSVVVDQAEDCADSQLFLTCYTPEYTVTCNGDGITKDTNSFVVTTPGASVTLSFRGGENSETYVFIDGLTFEGIPEYELYFGEQDADPMNLYNKTRWNLLSHKKQQEIIRERVFWSEPQQHILKLNSSAGVSKELEYVTPYYNFYCGRHDFTVNLGYSKEPVTDVTISFPYIGTYSFDDIGVACQPMDHYSDQIDELKQDTLDNMEIGVNTVSGIIDLDTNKWLCFAIPYSDGWRAYIDGEETELHQANIQYMAVRLSAGEHTVRLVYETPWLRVGLYISLSTCAGLIVWGIIGFVKKRRQTGHVFPR